MRSAGTIVVGAAFALAAACASLENLEGPPLGPEGGAPDVVGTVGEAGDEALVAQDGGASDDSSVPVDAPTSEVGDAATEAAPTFCTLPWGGTISNGTIVQAFPASSVTCTSTCVSQPRKCTNGVLDGSGTHETCTVASCSACGLPWGGTIASGTSVPAYATSSVACGGTCAAPVTRHCLNGVLDGSGTYESCSAVCAPCSLPWGGTIASGQKVWAYPSSSAPCGGSCGGQWRTCTNGVLSNSGTHDTCSVATCSGCAATSVNWSQQQAVWAGNTNTAGTYTCSGDVAASAHGTTVSPSFTTANHVGSAQFSCNNGSWQKVSGTCDGAIVTVTQQSGWVLECSGTGVRGMFIGWYLSELARCGDYNGLNFWVTSYNAGNTCQPVDNYGGFGSEAACWKNQLHLGGGACYTETSMTNHICATSDTGFCGAAVYPWGASAAQTYGTTCKYPPP